MPTQHRLNTRTLQIRKLHSSIDGPGYLLGSGCLTSPYSLSSRNEVDESDGGRRIQHNKRE
jgi:hypothetical protein